MNRKQVDLILLGVSIFFFFSLAVSFTLMSIESETPLEHISIVEIIVGLMFWISLIMGIVTQCILARRRKKWYALHGVRKNGLSQRVGIISFFKNIYATVADITTIISFIGLVIALTVTHGIGHVCYVLISVFVFFFSMHCILNGKNYYYVVNQSKLLNEFQKERENSSR